MSEPETVPVNLAILNAMHLVIGAVRVNVGYVDQSYVYHELNDALKAYDDAVNGCASATDREFMMGGVR